MKTNRIRADLALLLVALIWGSAFVVQRVAARHFDPFTFNGLRFLLAGLLLLPFTSYLKRGGRDAGDPRISLKRTSSGYICLAGLLLFLAGSLQQAGLESTTAGNAGFITSLYVVLVPLLLAFLWKERVAWTGWMAAGLAVFGSLLLSTGGTLLFSAGDLLELCGAVFWAFHVILVGRAMKWLNILDFSVGQYLLAGVLNLVVSLLTHQKWDGFGEAWWTVIYIGLLSTAIGYTLQVYGQKTAPAADAAIILSMEAVFAALTGYLWLGENLEIIQIIGCVLILVAIFLSQLRVMLPLKVKISP
jgi:drug/metabolite transporter (DMT)-like permease